MPQFDVATYYSQIFWLSVVFCILYITVSRFIVPKLQNILNQRQNIIDDDLNDAAIITQQIDDLQQLYDKKFTLIVDEANAIKQNVLSDIKKSLDTKQEALSNALHNKNLQLNSEIDDAMKVFRSDKRSACLNLASFIITKITKQESNTRLLEHCYTKIKG